MAPNWPSSFRSKITTDMTLVCRREQDDGGGQLADDPDEDEAPGGDDAAAGQRRGDVAQDAQAARAQDAPRVLQLGRMPRKVASDCE